MTHKLPISAFIIALNEAERIGATLACLEGLVEEVVVIDSGSTDGTKDIAAQYGAKVIVHEWEGYGPQKRFGEEQCAHDWVLNLDADEVLSEALTEEIRTRFAAEKESVAGYYLLIQDCLPGEDRPRAFAHTTKAVRLYNKTKGRFPTSPVHDRVQFTAADARLEVLKAPVYHRSILSVEQAIIKLNRYSTMQAKDMKARGKRPSLPLLRLITEFPIAFLKSYLLRGDVLRGRAGFVNAMTYAFSRFARIAKLWDKTIG